MMDDDADDDLGPNGRLASFPLSIDDIPGIDRRALV